MRYQYSEVLRNDKGSQPCVIFAGIYGKFEEISEALKAEDPEFAAVWKSIERILNNAYIETADEYGLSRFEKILGILSSKEDTLESRRSRVLTRWLDNSYEGIKPLISKLEALCGKSNFSVLKEYQNYRIRIFTQLEMFGQTETLKHILESVIPCNMNVISDNKIICNSTGRVFLIGNAYHSQNSVDVSFRSE